LGLESQGYTELGVIGTSLGSCYAFLCASHEPRIKIAAFNHASTHFSDVVWTGQSTRSREGRPRSVHHQRATASPICAPPVPPPISDKYARYPRKSMIIFATYDLTFLPEYSKNIISERAPAQC